MTVATKKPDTDALLYDRLVQELADAEKPTDRVAAVAEAALAGKSATATARDLHAEDTSRSLLTKGLERAIASVVQRISEQVACERGVERAPHLRKLPDTADELVAALHTQIDANIASREAGDARLVACRRYNETLEKVNRAKLAFVRSRPDGMDRGAREALFDHTQWLDEEEQQILRDGNPRIATTR
jgi:hypothetical protein